MFESMGSLAVGFTWMFQIWNVLRSEISSPGQHLGKLGKTGKAGKRFLGFPRCETAFPGCVTIFPRGEILFPRSNFPKLRSQSTKVFPRCEKFIFPRSKSFILGSRSVLQDTVTVLASPDIDQSSSTIHSSSALVWASAVAYWSYLSFTTLFTRPPRRLPQFPNVLGKISQGLRAFPKPKFPPWNSQGVSPQTSGTPEVQWTSPKK